MLLELGKAISLFASILVLLPALTSAFFTTGMHWQDRLILTLLKLGFAACVCCGSGLLFAWPTPAHHPQRFRSTLPVQLFLWSLLAIAVLFAASWYLTCGNPLHAYNNTCG